MSKNTRGSSSRDKNALNEAGVVWTCEICKKEFKDDQSRILQCERCEGHYCAKCVKLSENEYGMISARKDFHWYCVGCEPKLLQSIQIDKDVEKKLTEFMAKVEYKMRTFEGTVYKKMTDFEEKLGKSDVNIASTEHELGTISTDIDKIHTLITNTESEVGMMKVQMEKMDKEFHKNDLENYAAAIVRTMTRNLRKKCAP